jgi:large subunit ribosomal protein L25
MISLEVERRDVKTNVDDLRKNGLVPAVFYGAQEESTPITVNAAAFLKVWDETGGSAIVDLVLKDGTKAGADNKEVLIQEVALHPVTGVPLHVDFYCIERGKKLTVSIPLNFIGEASVEKLGGIVVKVMHELEVEVHPRDIPQHIDVDLSMLTKMDSRITVADLALPQEIEPTDASTETVASVTEAHEEPVEEERDIADIEIEGEKKEGEDGALEGEDKGEGKGKEEK